MVVAFFPTWLGDAFDPGLISYRFMRLTGGYGIFLSCIQDILLTINSQGKNSLQYFIGLLGDAVIVGIGLVDNGNDFAMGWMLACWTDFA